MKIEKGDKYIIEIGEIHTHYDDNGHEYKLARIKGFKSLVFDENGLKKLERFTDKAICATKNEEKLLSCKFVVTKISGENHNITLGKIYEVKNGRFYDDNGCGFPLWEYLITFSDLEGYFARAFCGTPVKIALIEE